MNKVQWNKNFSFLDFYSIPSLSLSLSVCPCFTQLYPVRLVSLYLLRCYHSLLWAAANTSKKLPILYNLRDLLFPFSFRSILMKCKPLLLLLLTNLSGQTNLKLCSNIPPSRACPSLPRALCVCLPIYQYTEVVFNWTRSVSCHSTTYQSTIQFVCLATNLWVSDWMKISTIYLLLIFLAWLLIFKWL